MDFQKTTLANGLRVVTIPMPSMESATVEVFTGAGTRHEKEKVNGLAHFLEHMVFKGTKSYPSAQKVAGAVDSIGGEINAHTSKEATAYYIKAWEKHLPVAFGVLSEFIKCPLLKEEEIEKEKGVILEEIAMYEDLPMRKAPEVFEELLYEGSPLGWDILGRKETVSEIKREDFLNYREANYRPENMVVAVAGRFDKDKVLDMVEKAFKGITPSHQSSVISYQLSDKLRTDKPKTDTQKLKTDTRQLFEPEPQSRRPTTEKLNPTGKPELRVVDKKTEQAHIVLGVRGNKRGHPDRYKEAVLTAILGETMSSWLFTEIREKRGLAYYVRSYVERFIDRGYFATRAGVRLEKVDEAIQVILEQYAKSTKQDEITEEELQRSKEYLKGRLALGLEDTHSVCEFFGDQEILEGKMRTIKEIMAGIDAVTKDDVAKVASELFKNDKLNLVVVGPYGDPSRFENLLKL